jgi:Right handed beta helix region
MLERKAAMRTTSRNDPRSFSAAVLVLAALVFLGAYLSPARAATDTITPGTTLSGGPSGTVSTTSASFAFGSTESGSTFQCKLDSGSWAACTSPKSYSGLGAGSHTFSVRSVDKAGNIDPTPSTRTWTIGAASAPVTKCTTTVASAAAAQSSVSSAAAGAVVCLANGSYGEVTLSATKAAPGVTLRAANAGAATIAGASISGSNLTLASFVSTGSVQIEPGASGITIEHNRITGGGQGIDAGPTSTTTINDTKIIGNKLVGPFGEDAIHLNRYHDSNGDGIGILIEGNEITGVRENGNHSDCLQTVWVGDHIIFRKNYLHDNRCQGFFVKDQASLGGVSGPIAGIAVEDNLFVRDKEPCGAPATSCGQPMYFQVFGPYSGFVMKRNTIWGDGADSIAAFREGTGADSVIANNVIYRLWTDTDMSAADLVNNTICQRETAAGGSWTSSRPGETTACSLSFTNTAVDDYRISGSDRGVDWAPSQQHFGP